MIVLKTIVLAVALLFIGVQLGGIGLGLLVVLVVLAGIFGAVPTAESDTKGFTDADMDGDEDCWDVDDPRVPESLRRHAERFRKPVATVFSLGNDEYLLFHADGKLADAVVLHSE